MGRTAWLWAFGIGALIGALGAGVAPFPVLAGTVDGPLDDALLVAAEAVAVGAVVLWLVDRRRRGDGR